MTLVLPLPVTPARTCWVRPDSTPSTSWAIAWGWSPAGWKGASTRKRLGMARPSIVGRTNVREQSVTRPTRWRARTHFTLEVHMKDEIKGKADELKGKLTGDKKEEWKGKAEQAGDKLRRNARDIRDDVKDKAD